MTPKHESDHRDSYKKKEPRARIVKDSEGKTYEEQMELLQDDEHPVDVEEALSIFVKEPKKRAVKNGKEYEDIDPLEDGRGITEQEITRNAVEGLMNETLPGDDDVDDDSIS